VIFTKFCSFTLDTEMPLIFRIFENGRYETSVKKQNSNRCVLLLLPLRLFAPPPLSLQQRRREQSNGEDRDERDERDEGIRRRGRFAEEAASEHSERLWSKFQ